MPNPAEKRIKPPETALPHGAESLAAAETQVSELHALIQFMARQLDADSALLVVVDEERRIARIPYAWGLSAIGETFSFKPDDGFVGRALLQDGPLMEPLASDPLESIHLTNGVPITFAAGAPLRTSNGVVGVLCAGFGREREGDRPALLKTIASFAAVAGLWLEDPGTLVGLLQAAYEDPLTGCLTYIAMLQALEQEVKRCERYGHSLSCCFIDLDEFKVVNDTKGHAAGNRVLAAVAAAIRGRVRRVDIVGRYGGDEFVVVLPDTTSLRAGFLADALRGEIGKASTRVIGSPIEASIGVAEWGAGMGAEDLLERADLALRDAKAHHGPHQ